MCRQTDYIEFNNNELYFDTTSLASELGSYRPQSLDLRVFWSLQQNAKIQRVERGTEIQQHEQYYAPRINRLRKVLVDTYQRSLGTVARTICTLKGVIEFILVSA